MSESGWHIRTSLVGQPSRMRARARLWLLVAIALSATALVLGYLAVEVWLLWVLAVPAALGAGVWWIVWWTEWSASLGTGVDLIELEVADEGVVTVGGLAVAWPEISAVTYVWELQPGGGTTPEAPPAARRPAALDRSVRALTFALHDFDAVRDRAPAAARRRALVAPLDGAPGHVRVWLSPVPDQQMQAVLGLVRERCRAHGIPFGPQV